MPSDVCKQRSCEPNERAINVHEIKMQWYTKSRIFFVCVRACVRACVRVCVCVSGEGGEGTGEVIHLFQTLCVGRGEGTGNVIHLFQTALKNLAIKYFHFGRILILSSVV